MKIAVTGALGHIGSYIIREIGINNPQHQFLLIDNFLTQRYCSLFDLPKNISYKFIEIDVSSVQIDNYLKDVDIVIHLAAITDAANSFNNSEEVERNNLKATENVAKACLNNGSKLIFLSSTSVYGTANKVIDENCSKDELKPQSPYAETKLKEEELINNMENQGLKFICCRFGTIFGASQGMRFHTAVNKFCWQAVMGTEITVWETAYEQSRPYLDLKDASNSFEHIINKDLFSGETYNILTQNATVKEVINIIEHEVPNLKISFVKNKIMNQMSYEVMSQKFVSEGFKFKGGLKRGILETINVLRNSNNNL